jgi:hypothetical protein
MFLAIANNPAAKRGLIPYGMLLKVSYCSVVFYHWMGEDIPDIWKPFAICDLLFLFLFVAAWMRLGRESKEAGR